MRSHPGVPNFPDPKVRTGPGGNQKFISARGQHPVAGRPIRSQGVRRRPQGTLSRRCPLPIPSAHRPPTLRLWPHAYLGASETRRCRVDERRSSRPEGEAVVSRDSPAGCNGTGQLARSRSLSERQAVKIRAHDGARRESIEGSDRLTGGLWKRGPRSVLAARVTDRGDRSRGVVGIDLAGGVVVQALLGQLGGSSTDVTESIAAIAFVLAFTAVGVLVACRQPRNPMGWLLIALVLSVSAGTLGSSYARFDYANHHGTLPFGRLALLLSPDWEYAFVLVPLVVLLFPDGQLGRRWRWPLRAYLALGVAVVIGTISVAIAAFSLRIPVDNTGNLAGLNNPHGANAWFGPVQSLAFAACVVLMLAAIIHQVRCFRGASGERRQQLKWLAAGAGACAACFAVNERPVAASGLVGDLTFSVGLTVLPLAIGVGILKYSCMRSIASSAAPSPTRSSPRYSSERSLASSRSRRTPSRSRQRRRRRFHIRGGRPVQPAAAPHPAPCRPSLQPCPLRRRGHGRRVHGTAARRGRARLDPR